MNKRQSKKLYQQRHGYNPGEEDMMIAHYIRVFGDAYFECRTLPVRDVVAWMPLPEPYRRNGGKRL